MISILGVSHVKRYSQFWSIAEILVWINLYSTVQGGPYSQIWLLPRFLSTSFAGLIIKLETFSAERSFQNLCNTWGYQFIFSHKLNSFKVVAFHLNYSTRHIIEAVSNSSYFGQRWLIAVTELACFVRTVSSAAMKQPIYAHPPPSGIEWRWSCSGKDAIPD